MEKPPCKFLFSYLLLKKRRLSHCKSEYLSLLERNEGENGQFKERMPIMCMFCFCSGRSSADSGTPGRGAPQRGASPARTRSTGAVARGRCHGYHPFARPTARGGSEVSRALAREEAAAGAGREWFSGAVRAAWEHRGGGAGLGRSGAPWEPIWGVGGRRCCVAGWRAGNQEKWGV